MKGERIVSGVVEALAMTLQWEAALRQINIGRHSSRWPSAPVVGMQLLGAWGTSPGDPRRPPVHSRYAEYIELRHFLAAGRGIDAPAVERTHCRRAVSVQLLRRLPEAACGRAPQFGSALRAGPVCRWRSTRRRHACPRSSQVHGGRRPALQTLTWHWLS